MTGPHGAAALCPAPFDTDREFAMFFGWLRKKAAEGVVLGDGLRAVAPEGEEPPADLDDLRKMPAAAVPARELPPVAGDGGDGQEVEEAEARPVARAAATKGRKGP